MGVRRAYNILSVLCVPAAGPQEVYGAEKPLPGFRSALTRWLGSQVLGRTQPNGDSLLSVSAVVDGIVTFEDLGDAERFAALLEADGVDEVRPAQQFGSYALTGIQHQ